jgi:hypothetical protein
LRKRTEVKNLRCGWLRSFLKRRIIARDQYLALSITRRRGFGFHYRPPIGVAVTDPRLDKNRSRIHRSVQTPTLVYLACFQPVWGLRIHSRGSSLYPSPTKTVFPALLAGRFSRPSIESGLELVRRSLMHTSIRLSLAKCFMRDKGREACSQR